MEKYRNILILGAHGTGLLITAALCFMGGIYIFNDNVLWSQVIALLTLIILFLLVFWMSSAKERKDNKGFTVMEGIGLTVYLVVAVCSFILMAHFINVNLILKDDIVHTGMAKLDEMTAMVNTYEQKVEEVSYLMSAGTENVIRGFRTSERVAVLKDSLRAYGISVENPQMVESEVEAALNGNIDAAMRGIDDLKKENSSFYDRKQKVFVEWTAAEVQKALQDTDKRLLDNYTRLHEQFKSKTTPENLRWNAHPFELTLSAPTEDILDDPFLLMNNHRYSMVLPLLVALLIHLFILCPYILLGRYGIRRIYPSSKKVGNIDGSIGM